MGWWLALSVSLLAALCVGGGSRFALTHAGQASSVWILRVMAIGTGVLLVAVMLDFLPDSWDSAGELAPWAGAAGVIAMWGVTNISDVWFARTVREREGTSEAATETASIQIFTRASAMVLMLSLSFHTFLEGFSLSIAMNSLSAASLWFAFAMLIHKVPEGVLWGLSVLTAFPDAHGSHIGRLTYALLVPAACVLVGTTAGIFLAPVLSPQVFGFVSMFIAGALLFICLSELMPAIRDHASSTRSLNLWFLVGAIVMLIPIGIGNLIGGG